MATDSFGFNNPVYTGNPFKAFSKFFNNKNTASPEAAPAKAAPAKAVPVKPHTDERSADVYVNETSSARKPSSKAEAESPWVLEEPTRATPRIQDRKKTKIDSAKYIGLASQVEIKRGEGVMSVLYRTLGAETADKLYDLNKRKMDIFTKSLKANAFLQMKPDGTLVQTNEHGKILSSVRLQRFAGDF